MKSASWFSLIDLILITLYLPMVLTLHLHKSQLQYSGVMHAVMMSMQFTHDHSFICRVTSFNLSTLFHCCSLLRNNNMATNLKGLLQVTIVISYFWMWLLTSNIFGRWCSETVTLLIMMVRRICFILILSVWKASGVNMWQCFHKWSLKNPFNLKCEIYNQCAWVKSLKLNYT